MGYGKANQFLLGVQKQALKAQMRHMIQANCFMNYDMQHLYKTLITERVLIRFDDSNRADREHVGPTAMSVGNSPSYIEEPKDKDSGLNNPGQSNGNLSRRIRHVIQDEHSDYLRVHHLLAIYNEIEGDEN